MLDKRRSPSIICNQVPSTTRHLLVETTGGNVVDWHMRNRAGGVLNVAVHGNDFAVHAEGEGEMATWVAGYLQVV